MSSPASVLIVDDSEDIRELYTTLLSEHGYRVLAACSGDEALDLARRHRPDLLIVDVFMPGMDGLEMLMHLRSDLTPPIPPAIVCSGFDITEAEALRRGAVLFLRKPIDPGGLLQVVAHVLATRKPDPAVASAVERCLHEARMARLRARAEAETRLAALDLEGLWKAYEIYIDLCRRYFGAEGAFVVFLRMGRPIVFASAGEPHFERGSPATGYLAHCSDVIETGSSIIIPDAATHPCFSVDAKRGFSDGLRFFAGVPLYISNGGAVGALCIAARDPHVPSPEDVYLIEQLGRRGSMLLQHEGGHAAGDPPPSGVPGLLVPEVFDLFLSMELRAARRLGDSLELALVELVTDREMVAARDALLGSLDFKRLLVGYAGPQRLSIFKRASTTIEAGSAIQRACATLDRAVGVRAVGSVACVGDGRLFPGEHELTRLAEKLLLEAQRGNPGSVERFVLRPEGWPGDPHPAQ